MTHFVTIWGIIGTQGQLTRHANRSKFLPWHLKGPAGTFARTIWGDLPLGGTGKACARVRAIPRHLRGNLWATIWYSANTNINQDHRVCGTQCKLYEVDTIWGRFSLYRGFWRNEGPDDLCVRDRP